ncbi:unnamed protein product [Ambrosiozyma monospora]|uniref:Unnamed protein product n=1 Tax=Ambrosiozyma monospora TaxID=43982 RepID=A0ACB5TDZ1_AMBMO|nr:unnamed protein product [Ambrosiozyma monospora]
MIKGDVNCPSSDKAIKTYLKSDDFQNINSSTYDFYQSLSSVLPAKQFPSYSLNFGQAYQIFDYVNVNWIHDEDKPSSWNSTLLFQLRTLADAYQWGIANAATHNATIGGQSMLGAVYKYLNTTKVEGSPYINYFTGSYNTMNQMFSLMQMDKVSENFTGLPDYGATLVWDLLQETSSNDYYVQFSFMNGTTPDNGTPLVAYPEFGSSDTLMSWSDFETAIKNVSILQLSNWCSTCNVSIEDAPQCAKYSNAYEFGTQLSDKGVDLKEVANGDYSSLDIKKSSLTNAGAGGIGAGVTIFVFGVLGALGWLFCKSRKNSKKQGNDTVLPTAVSAKDEVSHKHDQVSSTSSE